MATLYPVSAEVTDCQFDIIGSFAIHLSFYFTSWIKVFFLNFLNNCYLCSWQHETTLICKSSFGILFLDNHVFLSLALSFHEMLDLTILNWWQTFIRQQRMVQSQAPFSKPQPASRLALVQSLLVLLLARMSLPCEGTGVSLTEAISLLYLPRWYFDGLGPGKEWKQSYLPVFSNSTHSPELASPIHRHCTHSIARKWGLHLMSKSRKFCIFIFRTDILF